MVIYACDICRTTSETKEVVGVVEGEDGMVKATYGDPSAGKKHRCPQCLDKASFSWGYYEDPYVRMGAIG